jgi:ribonuclease PH
VDCDVLQADGGTRTASITGAYVAVYQVALQIKDLLGLGELPLFDSLCGISVGVVDGRTLLDLDYEEDSAAAVDMNVVMTGTGKLVEVQATAEGEPYARATLDEMLELAAAGAAALAAAQAAVVEALG